jgi:predicted MFS family arabinose efflux permease
MAAAMGIGRFAYTPLLPEMVSTFGWNFAQAGDVASANFLGYMLGALLAPRLIHSRLLRLWVAFSLMLSVITTALGAEVDGYVAWLVVRFVSGVASALCLVFVTSHLIQVLSARRAERLGNVHFAGVGIGIIVCMATLGAPAAVDLQWARLGAASAVLMAFAWFLLSRETWAMVVPTSSKVGASTAEATGLWRIILGYGFFGFGYVVSATFIVAMATQVSDPGASSGLVWWIVGIAIVPSVYAWQWLANRIGLVVTLQIAYLVEALGALLAGVSGSMAGLIVACVLLGGTFAAITALGISTARAAAPARIAYAVSAMTTAFAFGQLVGPFVAGRMADAQGDFLLASIIAAGLLFVAGLLLQGLRLEPALNVNR